jgi:hypothetical protein
MVRGIYPECNEDDQCHPNLHTKSFWGCVAPILSSPLYPLYQGDGQGVFVLEGRTHERPSGVYGYKVSQLVHCGPPH